MNSAPSAEQAPISRAMQDVAAYPGAMPRVAVLGANGFVGRALLEHRHESMDWTLLTRSSGSCAAGAEPARRHCDLSLAESVAGALEGFDVLVNLVYDRACSPSENVRMMERLVDECRRSGVRKIIHVSTALVVGATDLPLVDEGSVCRPATDYENAKLEIEQRFRTLGPNADVVILRPTVVFGCGGINLRDFVATLRRENALKGAMRASIAGDLLMNLVPVQTVASSIMHFLRRASPIAGTYFVSQDDDADNTLSAVDAIVAEHFHLRRHFKARLARGPLRTLLLRLMKIDLDRRPAYSNARLRSTGFDDFTNLRRALDDYCRHQTRDVGHDPVAA